MKYASSSFIYAVNVALLESSERRTAVRLPTMHANSEAPRLIEKMIAHNSGSVSGGYTPYPMQSMCDNDMKSDQLY